VALHRETTLAVALALSPGPAATDARAGLAALLAATESASDANAWSTANRGVDRDHNGRGAGAEGSRLAKYQERYTRREEARDKVKLLLQQSNPDAYSHVEHTEKREHRQRMIDQARARRAGREPI
jgi:hypothetical protein